MVFPTSICFGWQAISILQSLCACLIIPVSFPPYSWPFCEYITILRQCSDISLLTLNVHYGPRDSKQQGQVVQTSKRDFFSVWMATVLFYRKMEMQLFSCLGRRNSLMLVFSVSEGQQPAQKKSLSDVLLSEWFNPQYCRVQMVCLQNEDYSQWAVRSKGSSVTTDPLVYVHAWKWKHGVKWVSSCAQALHLLCQKGQCKPNKP